MENLDRLSGTELRIWRAYETAKDCGNKYLDLCGTLGVSSVGGTGSLAVIALCSTGIPRGMNYSVVKVRFDTGFLIIFNPLYCLQTYFDI